MYNVLRGQLGRGPQATSAHIRVIVAKKKRRQSAGELFVEFWEEKEKKERERERKTKHFVSSVMELPDTFAREGRLVYSGAHIILVHLRRKILRRRAGTRRSSRWPNRSRTAGRRRAHP